MVCNIRIAFAVTPHVKTVFSHLLKMNQLRVHTPRLKALAFLHVFYLLRMRFYTFRLMHCQLAYKAALHSVFSQCGSAVCKNALLGLHLQIQTRPWLQQKCIVVL